MNSAIEKELAIFWSDDRADNINETLEALERLTNAVTSSDLPDLVLALKSDRNDFWTRELLAGVVCELGGISYLEDLFEALQQGFDEGHDNDTFCHHLTEIAALEPVLCKEALKKLLANPMFSYRESAEWLLEFCE